MFNRPEPQPSHVAVVLHGPAAESSPTRPDQPFPVQMTALAGRSNSTAGVKRGSWSVSVPKTGSPERSDDKDAPSQRGWLRCPQPPQIQIACGATLPAAPRGATTGSVVPAPQPQ